MNTLSMRDMQYRNHLDSHMSLYDTLSSKITLYFVKKKDIIKLSTSDVTTWSR